jgi:hypothetical protein
MHRLQGDVEMFSDPPKRPPFLEVKRLYLPCRDVGVPHCVCLVLSRRSRTDCSRNVTLEQKEGPIPYYALIKVKFRSYSTAHVPNQGSIRCETDGLQAEIISWDGTPKKLIDSEPCSDIIAGYV